MENKDALLIRKFITLVESVDEKVINHDNNENNNIEEPLDEQVKMFQDALKTLARTAQEEKGIWQTIKTEIPSIGNKFKNADEFKAAVEAGKIGVAESSSIVKFAIKNSPELAMKIKGLLKLQPEFAEMSKMVFPKGTQMAADVAKMEIAKKTLSQMGIGGKEAEVMLRDAAQQSAGTAKVTTKSVDKAISRRAKNLKGSSPEVSSLVKDTKSGAEAANTIKSEAKKVKDLGPEGAKLASKWEKAGVSLGKYSAKTWDKLKSLKGKMNYKNLILYGLAGWGSYEIIKSLFGSDDKDTKSGGVMPDCIANAEGTEIGTTSDGTVMVFTTKDIDSSSTGHGGAKFYGNNRVWTMDNAMSGTYGCKGNKVSVQSGNLKESVLMEELSDIIVTWDNKKTEPTTTEPTTTEPTIPKVSSSGGTKKSKYTDRNKFPYSLGHRSSIIKEVQVCFGFPKKYQTGNFGPITLKKLQDLYGVSEINESTYKLIKEKCKSKPTTGTTTNTSTTTTNTVTPTSTVTPTNTGTTTTTTQPIKTPLTRENCVKLFKEILKRDDKDGARTATDDEIVKCQKCLQQYNFGIGQGASKIKRAYALTSSGGNKGIRK
jgi:hypothetical protein